MTLGNLKNKIYSVLGASLSDEIPTLCFAADSSARKVAAAGRCIKKSRSITFTVTNGRACADIPENFLYAESIDGSGAENVEILNGKLCANNAGAGEHTVVYYAYPAPISESTPDETVLEYSDAVADAVAYGAATELCGKLYPGDIRRYMEIATEYDSRMADLISPIGAAVRNSVFSRARGVRR